MQAQTIPGGYWSAQFPDYTIRMEQMNKMFRVLESMGDLHILTQNLSLIPMEENHAQNPTLF